MTEKQFWQFLEKSWKDKGRVSQVSGTMDDSDSQMQAAGEYIGGHAILPKDYDRIPKETIIEMGNLLFCKEVKYNTKEAIMMILAHHISKDALKILEKYNLIPDKELKFFAEISLDECRMWNE